MGEPLKPERTWLIYNSLRLLNIRRIARDLRSEEESATIIRFFSSEHVKDLRLICGLALFIMLVLVFFALVNISFKFINLFSPDVTWQKIVTALAEGQYLDKLGILGSVIGVGIAVIAWAYKTAAIRLGVVDLFASEIVTICRVGTAMDFGRQSIEDYTKTRGKELTGPVQLPKSPKSKDLTIHDFTSDEEYFPIFAANSKDLEVLEANVVREIVSFYTYMKIIRDLLRQVSNMGTKEDILLPEIAELVKTRQNIIYMIFLAYEAARRSIDHLVEYEPTHAENTIIILLTEIVVYKSLLDIFAETAEGRDFRYARLRLRQRDYMLMIKNLKYQLDHVDLGRGSFSQKKKRLNDWKKAGILWEDLKKRCDVIAVPDLEDKTRRRLGLGPKKQAGATA